MSGYGGLLIIKADNNASFIVAWLATSTYIECEQIHDRLIITNVIAAIIKNNKRKAYHVQEDRTWSSHGCLVQSHHNSAEFLNNNEPLIVNKIKQCTGIFYASMLSNYLSPIV